MERLRRAYVKGLVCEADSKGICISIRINNNRYETHFTNRTNDAHSYLAAIRYQNELASTCSNLKILGYDFDTDTLDVMTSLVKSLQDSVSELESAMAEPASDDLMAEAKHCCEVVLPAMNKVRSYADALEGYVADDLWPLPTYQEMLFIK